MNPGQTDPKNVQKALKLLAAKIETCERCPRLRKHCLAIARVKRRAFAGDTYWGKPIKGFGDPRAQLVVIGLAPAAHGANRTGRVFTGDRSGDWLYRALHKAGFANQPHSTRADDGLALHNAYVTATVKCAPPDNKPTPTEIRRCLPYLEQELALLSGAHVYIALGRLAWDEFLRPLNLQRPKPVFGHGASFQLPNRKWLIGSYHPSQQNTFTGKLTEPMFDSVFVLAKAKLR